MARGGFDEEAVEDKRCVSHPCAYTKPRTS
jgi:hypothetical protein